jgi:hypothetical protein
LTRKNNILYLKYRKREGERDMNTTLGKIEITNVNVSDRELSRIYREGGVFYGTAVTNIWGNSINPRNLKISVSENTAKVFSNDILNKHLHTYYLNI